MENDGTGQYINERTYLSPDMSACAVIHDRDNDGDMDITMIDEAADVVILYNNTNLLNNTDHPVEQNLKLYPNPFKEDIFFSGEVFDKTRLELFDINGRLLVSKEISGINNVDLSHLNLSDGTYIAKVYTNNTMQQFKLIKMTH